MVCIKKNTYIGITTALVTCHLAMHPVPTWASGPPPTCDVAGISKQVVTVQQGGYHTCVLLDNGEVKCWGYNEIGQLGLGDTSNRGNNPNEMGDNRPAVDLGAGRVALAVSAGDARTCVLLDNGEVKCWGNNDRGELGLGDRNNRGDNPNEMGDNLPAVDLGAGRVALAVSTGTFHTCALLDNGEVKCWGFNDLGQLGLGDTNQRGGNPNEMGDNLPAVDLGAGRVALAVSAGTFHTCALLDNEEVKCWGRNHFGQLGLGDTNHRGDNPNEMGDNLPAVDLGAGRVALAVSTGTFHTCALLDNREVKCWGINSGQLGLGDRNNRGDNPNEMGDNLPAVDLGAGRVALAVSAGPYHTCALLDNREVKCWGNNGSGQLGLGDTNQRGDNPNEMGDNLPVVDLGAGRVALAVSAGSHHTCALLDNREVKCWGINGSGQLGLGDTLNRLSPSTPLNIGCVDVNSCEDPNACPEDSTCADLLSGWSCKCVLLFVNKQSSIGVREVPPDGECIPVQLEVDLATVSSGSLVLSAKNSVVDQSGVLLKVVLNKWISSSRTETVSLYEKSILSFPAFNAEATTKVFTQLDPGSKYQVVVTALDENEEEIQGIVPQSSNAETWCACAHTTLDADTTGSPLDVVTQQDQGYVMFRFRDNSKCEEAYAFSRKSSTGKDTVFTPNYYFISKTPCAGEPIQPGRQAADNLGVSNLLVGQTYQYFVRAVSRTYSFSSRSSESTMVEHIVQWESSLAGSVTLEKVAGFLPVPGVAVEYQLRSLSGQVIPSCNNNAGEWCRTITGAGGSFFVAFKLSNYQLTNTDHFPVHFRFAKQTGNVTHSFLCDEGTVDCGSDIGTIAYLSHLSFNTPLHIIDDTTVPFVGKVTVAGTEHAELDDGCPLVNATVCLQTSTGNRGTGGLVNGACVETDSFGVYRVPAVIGTRVHPKVSFHEHEFQPANPAHTQMFQDGIMIESDVIYEKFDLKDMSKVPVRSTVAGGLCNNVLGKTTIQVVMPNCPTWPGATYEQTGWEQFHQVVAQTVLVEVISVVSNDDDASPRLVILESLSHQSKNLDLVSFVKNANDVAVIPEGLGSTNPEEQVGASDEVRHEIEQGERDGEKQSDLAQVRFQYDGVDRMNVRFGENSAIVSAAADTCGTAQDGVDSFSLHTVTSGTMFLVLMRLYQDFGYDDIATCSQYPPNYNVVLQNQVGVSEDEDEDFLNALPKDTQKLLLACNPTCLLPVSPTNGTSDVFLVAGRPNPTGSFSKNIHITVQKTGVQHRAEVVVVGDYTISDKFSMALPTHKPVLVLRDPPGGNSYSYYKNMHTSIEVHIQDTETFVGFDSNVNAAFGSSSEISQCAGIGVQLCLKAISTDVHTNIGFDSHSLFQVKMDNSVKNNEFTTTWSYETSRDTWLVGAPSDVFLVPIVNVQYKLVTRVSWSESTCASGVEETVFALDSTSKKAIAFLNRFDVDSTEIPNMEKRLADVEAVLEESPSDADAIVKKGQLEAAINNWKSFLAEHDATTAAAESGDLEKLDKPHEWLEKMEPNNNDDDDDNYSKLPENHWSGLVPEQLVKQATPLNNAPNFGGSDLESINVIKFTGGDSRLEYSLRQGMLSDHTFMIGAPRENSKHDTATGFDHEATIKSLASFAIKVGVKIITHNEKKRTETSGTRNETQVGFVLGDEDSRDVFDVEIYLDPKYGTFVFRTLSGQSRCPVEPNTVPHEIAHVEIRSRPSGLVDPSSPMVFKIDLTNLGISRSAFQVFTNHRENTGLLSVKLNGGVLAGPQQYDRIESFETFTTTLSVSRGPVQYDYDPLTIVLRSACEFTRNIGDGNLVALEDTVLDSVEIFNFVDENNKRRLRFAEPCPKIVWASTLANERGFLINTFSLEQDSLPVVIRNLDASVRSFQDSIDDPLSRLERVEFKFRPMGTGPWFAGFTAGSPRVEIDFAQLTEDDFGFVPVSWSLDGLMDGAYEIEARTVCTPAPDLPTEFNEFVTSRLMGVIDRTPPVLFGLPVPTQGVLYPGQGVHFEFNEILDCSQPFIFDLSVTVEGIDREFDNDNMLLVCQDRTITFQFDYTARFDEMAGRVLSIELGDVRDRSGNPITHPILHSLVFADFNPALSGAVFDIRLVEPLCLDATTVLEISAKYVTDIAKRIAGYLNVSVRKVKALGLSVYRCIGPSELLIKVAIAPSEELPEVTAAPSTSPTTPEVTATPSASPTTAAATVTPSTSPSISPTTSPTSTPSAPTSSPVSNRRLANDELHGLHLYYKFVEVAGNESDLLSVDSPQVILAPDDVVKNGGSAGDGQVTRVVYMPQLGSSTLELKVDSQYLELKKTNKELHDSIAELKTIILNTNEPQDGSHDSGLRTGNILLGVGIVMGIGFGGAGIVLAAKKYRKKSGKPLHGSVVASKFDHHARNPSYIA